MTYLIERLTPQSALEVAARILPADWEECVAATDHHPGAVLVHQASLSYPSFVVYRKDTDEPILTMGAEPGTDDNVAYVWLMATDALRLRDAIWLRKKLQPGLRALATELRCDLETFRCWASENNNVHRRWLNSVGFIPTGREKCLGGHRFKERMYVCS